MSYRLKRVVPAAALLGLLAGCGAQASDHNSLGTELYDKQRYAESLNEYQEAARLAPDRPEPLANAGNARHQLQDYLGAADDQQAALSLASPELQAGLYYNLGNSYFRLREFEAALESYKQALRLAPDDVDAKWNLELAQQMLDQQQQQQQASNQGQPQQDQGGDQQQEQQGPDQQPRPGGGEQREQLPEPPPPSMSQEEAERQLDQLRRREERRSDDIYRDYAVGGDGSDIQDQQSSGEERDW